MPSASPTPIWCHLPVIKSKQRALRKSPLRCCCCAINPLSSWATHPASEWEKTGSAVSCSVEGSFLSFFRLILTFSSMMHLTSKSFRKLSSLLWNHSHLGLTQENAPTFSTAAMTPSADRCICLVWLWPTMGHGRAPLGIQSSAALSFSRSLAGPIALKTAKGVALCRTAEQIPARCSSDLEQSLKTWWRHMKELLRGWVAIASKSMLFGAWEQNFRLTSSSVGQN